MPKTRNPPTYAKKIVALFALPIPWSTVPSLPNGKSFMFFKTSLRFSLKQELKALLDLEFSIIRTFLELFGG